MADDLPSCPQCGVAVQPHWDWCQACGYDPDGLRPAGAPTTPPTPPGAPPPPIPPPPYPVDRSPYPPPTPGTPTFAPPRPPAPPAPPVGGITSLTAGPRRKGINPWLATGLAVGVVMLLLGAGLGAVTLIGRQPPVADSASAPTVLPSSPTTTPRTAPGASPSTTAPGSPTTPGAGATAAVNPMCATVPPIVPNPGPADPDRLVDATFDGTIDLVPVEQAYGPLTLDYVDRWDNVPAFMTHLITSDMAARQARLEADGFRGAAQRGWLSSQGDEIDLLTVALADQAAAVDYAQFHLSQMCAEAFAVGPSDLVPGGVTMYTQNEDGRPQVRVVAVVGNTEINVKICTCHPGDLSRLTAEEWAARIAGLSAANQV